MKNDNRGCILIDYDAQHLPDGWRKTIDDALAIMGLRYIFAKPEKTANGWHIVIGTQERLPPLAILYAQAIVCAALGADWKREACNFRRALRGIYLNVLFEPSEVQK